MLFLALIDEEGNVLGRFDSTKPADHEIFNNLMLDAKHLLSANANEKLSEAVDDFYA